MKLSIGLSYAPEGNPKHVKYINALLEAGKTLGHEVIVSDLFAHPEFISEIDGIIFTGGSDVDPSLYGKPELRIECEDINPARDDKEFAFAARADERELPILGICRGLQLLNVHYGGTLIADLEHAGKPSHTKINGIDRRHQVHIEPGTLVKKISGVSDGDVTSAHHQAIDILAPGMAVSAKSSGDGVVEAIEWDDPKDKPYFLAVQWHPERMEFTESLAGSLFESFLWEVAARKLLSARIKK